MELFPGQSKAGSSGDIRLNPIIKESKKNASTCEPRDSGSASPGAGDKIPKLLSTTTENGDGSKLTLPGSTIGQFISVPKRRYVNKGYWDWDSDLSSDFGSDLGSDSESDEEFQDCQAMESHKPDIISEQDGDTDEAFYDFADGEQDAVSIVSPPKSDIKMMTFTTGLKDWPLDFIKWMLTWLLNKIYKTVNFNRCRSTEPNEAPQPSCKNTLIIFSKGIMYLVFLYFLLAGFCSDLEYLQKFKKEDKNKMTSYWNPLTWF